MVEEELNQAEQDPQAAADDWQAKAERANNLKDLLAWAQGFVDSSMNWRRTSFEDQWRRWQRNADGVFDPDIKAKKEAGQSTAFVPLTPAHRETIHGERYKVVIGSNPMMEIKKRPNVPQDRDQSANIKDMELRELEKSRFAVEYEKIMEDSTTYGSGFCKAWWERRMEDRVLTVPVYEQVNIADPTSVFRAMTGKKRIVSYGSEVRSVEIYNGVRIQHISIWDVFPDPKALTIKGHAIATRYNQTFQDILDGIKAGYNLPECEAALRNLASEDITPVDKKVVEIDRKIADFQVTRTENQRNLECFELWARLPKKWVLINGGQIDDPEALIPARVRFHKNAVIGVEPNNAYDGEPQIFKDDYKTVAGQFYGRGIPERLKDAQLISNEEVNQRLDAKALKLNPTFGVIEKALVDNKDLVSKIGGVIRLNANAFGGQPFKVDDVLQELGMSPIDSAAFIEPQEWERWAQEVTGANRATLANRGPGQDANETLGGMRMMRDMASEKFAYLGLVEEHTFFYDLFRAVWRLIYQNLTPEYVEQALGPERAATFIPLSPEEVENGYQYLPQGAYTMQSKGQRSAFLAAIREQYAGLPWINDMAFFEKQLSSIDEEPGVYRIGEDDAAQIMLKAQQMAEPMAKKMLLDMVMVKASKDLENNADQILAEHQAEKSEKKKQQPKGATA